MSSAFRAQILTLLVTEIVEGPGALCFTVFCTLPGAQAFGKHFWGARESTLKYYSSQVTEK
jgi:hypothetical protein